MVVVQPPQQQQQQQPPPPVPRNFSNLSIPSIIISDASQEEDDNYSQISMGNYSWTTTGTSISTSRLNLMQQQQHAHQNQNHQNNYNTNTNTNSSSISLNGGGVRTSSNPNRTGGGVRKKKSPHNNNSHSRRVSRRRSSTGSSYYSSNSNNLLLSMFRDKQCTRTSRILFISFSIGLLLCLFHLLYIINFVGSLETTIEKKIRYNQFVSVSSTIYNKYYHRFLSKLINRRRNNRNNNNVTTSNTSAIITGQATDSLLNIRDHTTNNNNNNNNNANKTMDQIILEKKNPFMELTSADNIIVADHNTFETNNANTTTTTTTRNIRVSPTLFDNSNTEKIEQQEQAQQQQQEQLNHQIEFPLKDESFIRNNLHDKQEEQQQQQQQEQEQQKYDELTRDLIGFTNIVDTSTKDPIIQLVIEAIGIEAYNALENETIALLPTIAEVIQLYGTKPIVYGLETCSTFQLLGNPSDHFLATAGTFNTGTNLMSELLLANCYLPERKKINPNSNGIRWQVQWGKHTPITNETYRLSHSVFNDTNIHPKNILPAVMIRDPFKWMQSMCRHEYGAHWLRDFKNPKHCPNLIKNVNNNDDNQSSSSPLSVPVTVRYKEFEQHHDSLVDFFNDWYQDYIHASFPRLIVRFEDIIFHPKEVTKVICECAGGEMNTKMNLQHHGKEFIYITESAKKGEAHGKEKTSYIDALVKYGTEKGRYNGYDFPDLVYAQQHLNQNIMNQFGYHYPKTIIS